MTKAKTKVAIGIPAYGPQQPSFWVPYSESIASLHRYDIDFAGTYWQGSSAVDINRNMIVHDWYEEERSNWLWWIDADNPPPIGALQRLLDLNKPLVSGTYYSTQHEETVSPIAYRRDNRTGLYYALPESAFEKGEILQVDAVGMGCFLTHRKVYEGIMERYTAFLRVYGGALVIRTDLVKDEVPSTIAKHPYAGQIRKGIHYEPIVKNTLPDAIFPFFLAQHTRTEDMHFCELARNIGYEIWLDTSVEAPHVKESAVTGEDFRDQKRPDSVPQDIEHV